MNAKDSGHQGLALLKAAILECLKRHPDGLGNADIADMLDMHSDYLGGQKDYLTWSVLGLLLNEKKVLRKGRRYHLPDASTPRDS
jgi:hypothetical protein